MSLSDKDTSGAMSGGLTGEERQGKDTSSSAKSGGLTGKESQGKDTSFSTKSGGLTGEERQDMDTLSGAMSGGLTGKERQDMDTLSGAMSGGLTGKERQVMDTLYGAMSGGLIGKESQGKDTSSSTKSGGLTGKESQGKDTSFGAKSGGLTGKEKRNKASENNLVGQNTRKAAAIPKEVDSDILAQCNQFSPLENVGRRQHKQKNNVQPNDLEPLSSMEQPRPPDMFSHIRFSLKTKFSCNICNIKIDSYIDVLNHMMSEAHQRLAAIKTTTLLEKNARKNQHRKELRLKRVFKKLSEEDKQYIIMTPAGKLSCEPCAKSLHTPKETHDHLASKLHAQFKKSAEFTKLCKDNFILQVEVSHWQCSVCKSLSDVSLNSIDSVFHHVKSDRHGTEMKHWQEQNVDVPLTHVTLSEAGEYKKEPSFDLTISSTNVPKETGTSAKLIDESASTVVGNESNCSEAALKSVLSTIVDKTEVGARNMCNGIRDIDVKMPQKLPGKIKSSIEASKLANRAVHENVTDTKFHTDVNVPSVVLINALDNARFSESNIEVNVDNAPWISTTNDDVDFTTSEQNISNEMAASNYNNAISKEMPIGSMRDGSQSKSPQVPSLQCLLHTAKVCHLQQLASQKHQSSSNTRSKDSETSGNVAPQLTRSKDSETSENVAPQLTRSKDSETSENVAPQLTRSKGSETSENVAPQLTRSKGSGTSENVAPQLTRSKGSETSENVAPQLTRSKGSETSENVAPQLTRSKDSETSENVAPQLTRSKGSETSENVAPQLTRSKGSETSENVAPQLTRSKDSETSENIATQLTRSKDSETSENVAPQLTRSKGSETSENVALQLTRSKDSETSENVAPQLTRSKDSETSGNVAPQLTRSKDSETSGNVAPQLTRSKDSETSENVAPQLTRINGHKKTRKLIRRNFRNLHNSIFKNAPDLLLSSKSFLKPFSETTSKCSLCRKIIPLDLDAYISHVNIDKHKTRLQAHQQMQLSIDQHNEILKVLPGSCDSNKIHLKLSLKMRTTHCRLCETYIPLDYNEYHSHVTGPKHIELLQKFEVQHVKNKSHNKQSPRLALLSALTGQKRSDYFLCEQGGNSSDSDEEYKESAGKNISSKRDRSKHKRSPKTNKQAISVLSDKFHTHMVDRLQSNNPKIQAEAKLSSKDTFLAQAEGKCLLKGYDSQDKLIQNGGKSSNDDVGPLNFPTKKEALSKDGSPIKSVQKSTPDRILNAKMTVTRKINKNNSEDLDLTLHPDVYVMLKSQETLLDHCSRLSLLASNTSHPEFEQRILRLLEDTLKPAFGKVRATLFGSRASGLALPGSDLDIFIDLESSNCAFHESQSTQQFIVRMSANVLRQHPDCKKVCDIPWARTPIVKLLHAPTQLNCDLTFKNGLSVENTKLLRLYTEYDERVKQLVLVVRLWSKLHMLTASNKFTNYALTVMTLFYLMRCRVIPPVEFLFWKYTGPKKFISGWEVSFLQDMKATPLVANKQSLDELVAGFFHYYSTYDYATLVVCPLRGQSLSRDMFRLNDLGRLPLNYIETVLVERREEQFRHYTPVCVQDPFDLSHNLTKAVSPDVLNKFIHLCNASWELCNGLKV